MTAPQLPSPPLLLDLANGEEATSGGNNKGADGSYFPTPIPLLDPGGGEAGHDTTRKSGNRHESPLATAFKWMQ